MVATAAVKSGSSALNPIALLGLTGDATLLLGWLFSATRPCTRLFSNSTSSSPLSLSSIFLLFFRGPASGEGEGEEWRELGELRGEFELARRNFFDRALEMVEFSTSMEVLVSSKSSSIWEALGVLTKPFDLMEEAVVRSREGRAVCTLSSCVLWKRTISVVSRGGGSTKEV